MKRLDRIKWTNADLDIYFKAGPFGINQLIDDTVKTLLRVNDDEYNFICGQMKDNEFAIVSSEKLSVSDIKIILNFRNKYLLRYHQRDGINPVGIE